MNGGRFLLFLCGLYVCVRYGSCLDNGLCLTPPMGWMVWERFRCNVDCEKDPQNCISEKLFMQMADHMATDGYKEAGYEYISIDDCWMSRNRTASGEIQPDPARFPHGIAYLAEYIHAKGLKLGIYTDIGTKTCAGFPGMQGHFQQDAKTFAKWGVDYLKLDGCYADTKTYNVTYPQVSKALLDSGRKIAYSCSWPAYVVGQGKKPNYALIAENCNLWRNYDDIQDSWSSTRNIMDWFAKNQDDLIPVAGPTHWNDPDELIIGDSGLNQDQSKSQFAIWAILAAPLFMSNDLRNISPWAKEILLNKEVIAVNQDKMGRQGRRVDTRNSTEVWCRPLHDGSVAVALLNRREQAFYVVASFEEVGLTSKEASIRDLFEQKDLGTFTDTFNAKVNPDGAVIVKMTPIHY